MAGKNNIIICEGETDSVLLQYYMRKVNGWSDTVDKSVQESRLKPEWNKKRSRSLIRELDADRDVLTLMPVGGCERLAKGLDSALERNVMSAPGSSEPYNRIVIIRDRDDGETEELFLSEIDTILEIYNVVHSETLSNNTWHACEMQTQLGIKITFQLLLMIIPFEENGAMETFLLNAICNKDPYDKIIINKCREFVDDVDPEKRYLNKRRLVTKAKFDTYFSIRTSADQFLQRQNIIKNVEWEQYPSIQRDFENLSAL
ncbi:MAG: hypothetical protein LUC90_02535 [Lachnospiraceae bacterium]|nr:hypothetical protein [Lachnospiraceae bacterium]